MILQRYSAQEHDCGVFLGWESRAWPFFIFFACYSSVFTKADRWRDRGCFYVGLLCFCLLTNSSIVHTTNNALSAISNVFFFPRTYRCSLSLAFRGLRSCFGQFVWLASCSLRADYHARSILTLFETVLFSSTPVSGASHANALKSLRPSLHTP